jgi:hypothetical protein
MVDEVSEMAAFWTAGCASHRVRLRVFRQTLKF